MLLLLEKLPPGRALEVGGTCFWGAPGWEQGPVPQRASPWRRLPALTPAGLCEAKVKIWGRAEGAQAGACFVLSPLASRNSGGFSCSFLPKLCPRLLGRRPRRHCFALVLGEGLAGGCCGSWGA